MFNIYATEQTREGIDDVLMINQRRLALAGAGLQQACTATIRTRLLKIGTAVLRNARRVRVMLASQHPLRAVFERAATALAASP